MRRCLILYVRLIKTRYPTYTTRQITSYKQGTSERSLLYILKQLFLLGSSKVAPLSALELTKLNIHEADSLEFCDSVVQIFTHASDLTVKTLVEYDPESLIVDGDNFAGKCELT